MEKLKSGELCREAGWDGRAKKCASGIPCFWCSHREMNEDDVRKGFGVVYTFYA